MFSPAPAEPKSNSKPPLRSAPSATPRFLITIEQRIFSGGAMKNIAQIISNPTARPADTQAPLTQPERDAIGYFFFRLRLFSPMFYEQIAPDEKTERLVKREYAAMLRVLSREQIDAGLRGYKRLVAEGHP